MGWSRHSRLRAELGQPASILLLADPMWPFEAVATSLRDLGYTAWIARSREEAQRHLSSPACRVDVVVAYTSTGNEDSLRLVFEADSTHLKLRVLVILDLEHCPAPLVIAWRLARLHNATLMIDLSASSERIVSRIEALCSRPAPLPHPTPVPVDRVAQARDCSVAG